MNNQLDIIKDTHSEDANSDLLILVDSDDQEIGLMDKTLCHEDQGKLHRAFSIFLFNRSGEVLIQQRATSKPLWGDFWSNTCCSHPRAGESIDSAASRRIEEELGIQAELSFIYKFEYQARFNEQLSENELCSVYFGHFDGAPTPNPNEVQSWKWISRESLTKELRENADLYTPWLKLEWSTLNEDYAAQFENI
jgi:isopentenyl-diphosphate delta-isomerase